MIRVIKTQKNICYQTTISQLIYSHYIHPIVACTQNHTNKLDIIRTKHSFAHTQPIL